MDKNINDLIKLFTDLEKKLVAELPKISDEMAINFNSMAQNELRTKGVKGAKYSKKHVPAFFLYGKAINAAGEAFLKENNDKNDLVTWAELRAAQGLQVNYVDLTYSGRMLQNTAIVSRDKAGPYAFYSTIGGFDKETKDKLRWNRIRYGEFLAPNKSDAQKVKNIPEIRARKVIETVLFNKA